MRILDVTVWYNKNMVIKSHKFSSANNSFTNKGHRERFNHRIDESRKYKFGLKSNNNSYDNSWTGVYIQTCDRGSA